MVVRWHFAGMYTLRWKRKAIVRCTNGINDTQVCAARTTMCSNRIDGTAEKWPLSDNFYCNVYYIIIVSLLPAINYDYYQQQQQQQQLERQHKQICEDRKLRWEHTHTHSHMCWVHAPNVKEFPFQSFGLCGSGNNANQLSSLLYALTHVFECVYRT